MFLQTQRTKIRPLVPQDLDKLYKLCSNADAMRFIPPHFGAETKKYTKSRLDNYIDHYGEHGVSFGLVTDKQGHFLGRAGLYFVPEVNLYELGYSLLPEYWGQGIATELALSLLDYAFDTLCLDAVCARTITGNNNSDKVLQKAGFSYLGERMFTIKDKPYFWNYYECNNDRGLDIASHYSGSAIADDWAVA